MKHFSRLKLLTLALVALVAVSVSFLPRHAAAAPAPPPPPQVELYNDSGAHNGCWYQIPAESSCFSVPTGHYFVVTDVRVITGPTIPGDHISVTMGAYITRDLLADANGYADLSEDYTTGFAVSGSPSLIANAPPAVSNSTGPVSFQARVTGFVQP